MSYTDKELKEKYGDYVSGCECCEELTVHESVLEPNDESVHAVLSGGSMGDEWSVDGQHYCYLCEVCQEEAVEI